MIQHKSSIIERCDSNVIYSLFCDSVYCDLPNGHLIVIGWVVSAIGPCSTSLTADTLNKYWFPSTSWRAVQVKVSDDTSLTRIQALLLTSRLSMMYEVTGVPPVSSGADQDTSA